MEKRVAKHRTGQKPMERARHGRSGHLQAIRFREAKPEYNMPYAPAIKVHRGKIVFFSGVVAAPIYHHHPHRPEEFAHIPADGAAQARLALKNLKRVLEASGGTLHDVVYATRFFTNLQEDQDAVNQVWNEFFGGHVPCTTTVQITRLGTDPRLRLEIAAIAVVRV